MVSSYFGNKFFIVKDCSRESLQTADMIHNLTSMLDSLMFLLKSLIHVVEDLHRDGWMVLGL